MSVFSEKREMKVIHVNPNCYQIKCRALHGIGRLLGWQYMGENFKSSEDARQYINQMIEYDNFKPHEETP